jgi:hypothetical protein
MYYLKTAPPKNWAALSLLCPKNCIVLFLEKVKELLQREAFFTPSFPS